MQVVRKDEEHEYSKILAWVIYVEIVHTVLNPRGTGAARYAARGGGSTQDCARGKKYRRLGVGGAEPV